MRDLLFVDLLNACLSKCTTRILHVNHCNNTPTTEWVIISKIREPVIQEVTTTCVIASRPGEILNIFSDN